MTKINSEWQNQSKMIEKLDQMTEKLDRIIELLTLLSCVVLPKSQSRRILEKGITNLDEIKVNIKT
jgi:Zn-dependent oligopeptidase